MHWDALLLLICVLITVHMQTSFLIFIRRGLERVSLLPYKRPTKEFQLCWKSCHLIRWAIRITNLQIKIQYLQHMFKLDNNHCITEGCPRHVLSTLCLKGFLKVMRWWLEGFERVSGRFWWVPRGVRTPNLIQN